MQSISAVFEKLPLTSFVIVGAGAIVSFFTPWPASLIVLSVSLIVGLSYKRFAEPKASVSKSTKYYLLAGGILITITSALLPLLRFGQIYFGYDIGFYKHYLEQPLTTFPRAVALLLPDSAVGSRLVLDALSLTGLPSSFLLLGSIAAWFVLGGLFFFLYTRSIRGTTTAAFAWILFGLSFALGSAYQLFLWKQLFAICLLFLIYWLLAKKPIWAIIPAALIMVSHRTTSIFLIISVLPALWFSYPQYRKWIAPLTAILGLGFVWWQKELLLVLERALTLGKIAPDYFAVTEGQFMSVETFLAVSALLIPFAIAGVVYDKKRLTQPFFWLGLASVVFLVFQLPFYKRTLIFLDLSLIYYASVALGMILNGLKTRTEQLYYVALLHLLLVPWLLAIVARPATVTAEYLQTITAFNQYDTQIPIMVMSSRDAPWVWGWSGHNMIAPGLYNDRWALNEWLEFWTTSESAPRQALLNRYPVAPYIFVSSPNLMAYPLDPECFSEITNHLYRYTCSIKE